uniref:Peptidoglycan recognition protein S1 n=2 Tax=Azumapecten farreri TaxID=106299 RepID=Q1X7G2_AZUFA|nr:peptidoglycan recognition protein S1 precursor [Azumapecten farreri]
MEKSLWTSCLVVLLLSPTCLSITADYLITGPRDDKCAALGGICQNDNQYCTGSYFSNKCAGPVTTRCCTKNITIRDTKECKNVMIISRDSWGARRPVKVLPLKTPVGDFFLHHTDTKNCTTAKNCISIVKSIQQYHMNDKNWWDIAYSFLVGEDGHVYEGRGWKTVGSHTRGCNDKSLAASMIGNFNDVLPNAAALSSVKRLISCGVEIGRLSPNYSLFGHRDVRDTDCPGNALYKNMSSWTHFHIHGPGCP